MKRRGWQVWAGVAFALLFLAAQLVVKAPPTVSASGQRVVDYYRSHGGGIRLSAWLATIAAVPYVLFVCWLRSQLRGIGRDVAFFGGLSLGAASIVWTWFGAGLALHAEVLRPETARTLADVSAYYGPLLTTSALLLAAPLAWQGWMGDPTIPRWLCWLTLVFVIDQAVETFTVFGRSGFFGPGGGMNFLVGAPLFLVWVVATAIGKRTAPRSSQPA
jgi:hypothetical protein